METQHLKEKAKGNLSDRGRNLAEANFVIVRS